MGIRKSTYIEDYRMVHTWTDDDFGFKAEAEKQDWTWLATVGRNQRAFGQYQSAVDWILDEWRLAKLGLDSWEERAAVYAADDGKVWEDISDEEAQDYIDAARSSARREEDL